MASRLAPWFFSVGASFIAPTTTIFEDQDFVVSPSIYATTATPLILSSSARLVIAIRAESATSSKILPGVGLAGREADCAKAETASRRIRKARFMWPEYSLGERRKQNSGVASLPTWLTARWERDLMRDGPVGGVILDSSG